MLAREKAEREEQHLFGGFSTGEQQHHERERLRTMLNQTRAELTRERELRMAADQRAAAAEEARAHAGEQCELEMLNRLEWEEYGGKERAVRQTREEEIAKLQEMLQQYSLAAVG